MTTEMRSALLRVLPFLAVIIAICVAVTRQKINQRDIGIQPPASYKTFFAWWVFFLVFTVTTELVLFKAGLLQVTHWHHPFTSSVIRIGGIVLLAPVAEELIFRGLLLHKLLKWKIRPHMAVISQAVVFVLLHSFTFENTISSNIGIAQSFIDACLYAYARQHTCSLYTPVAMHASGNCIAVLEQFIL